MFQIYIGTFDNISLYDQIKIWQDRINCTLTSKWQNFKILHVTDVLYNTDYICCTFYDDFKLQIIPKDPDSNSFLDIYGFPTYDEDCSVSSDRQRCELNRLFYDILKDPSYTSTDSGSGKELNIEFRISSVDYEIDDGT